LVLRDLRDGVAVLTLNRPDRLNAWTQALENRYFDLLEESAADDEVRVILVTGAGRGFCAGADMEDLQTIGDDGIDAARASQRRPSACCCRGASSSAKEQRRSELSTGLALLTTRSRMQRTGRPTARRRRWPA